MKPGVFARLLFPLLVIALSACARASVSPAPEVIAPTAAQPASLTPTPVPTLAATSAPASLPQYGSLLPLSGSYTFTEGPAVDTQGSVYFSDIDAGAIYKWSTSGSVSVFVKGLNRPNGLMFDKTGSLVVCEGGSGRLISIDAAGAITVLASEYNGLRFNEPNDLWIDSQGGIYFTDPAYQAPVVQDGEHVYYISPDHSQVTRIISDLTRPNGIVGSADGRTLYVADHGAGKTYAYDITAAGSLANKRLFVESGSDGMDLDAGGNLYLTANKQVRIYSPSGAHLLDISVPQDPTNVAFAGPDRSILFVTARTAVYTAAASSPSTAAFTLTSPDLPADGRLPAEYTCDGASSTLALSWSGAPAGTKSFAVIMHHTASPTDIHWYWVLYNIPANVTSLAKNSTGIGTLGTNRVNDRNEYAPPCSKGPGDKTYIYTVYALSSGPDLTIAAQKVDRAALLAAISDITLASAELHVVYARP